MRVRGLPLEVRVRGLPLEVWVRPLGVRVRGLLLPACRRLQPVSLLAVRRFLLVVRRRLAPPSGRLLEVRVRRLPVPPSGSE